MVEACLVSKKTPEEYRVETENPYLQQEDFKAMEKGHEKHYDSVEKIETALKKRDIDYKEVAPRLLKEEEYDLAIIAGGDGMVLDTHPYIDDALTMTINTDPERSDGALHNFNMENFEEGLDQVLADEHRIENWTRIKAEFDSKTMLALNELYIGPESTGGVSEYRLKTRDFEESHRNSGIIVSSGRGSTGWYKNIYRDIHGEEKTYDPESENLYYISWQNMDETESAQGKIQEEESLTVKSEMNYDGKVKFDGDRRPVDFPRGREVEIRAGKPLKILV